MEEARESEVAGFGNLEELPQEVLFHILTYLLDVREVVTVSRVNKRFHALVNSNAVWKLLYYTKWESNPLLPHFLEVINRPLDSLKEDPDPNVSVKDLYRQKCLMEQRWFKGEWTRQRFAAHPGSSVNGLKFVAAPASSAPATLITCSDDQTIRVWQPSVGASQDSAPPGDDTQGLFSSLRQSTLRLMPKQQLECTTTLRGHGSVVWCVDYDGNVIVSGSFDESMIVWRDSAIAHNFTNVLSGGINGIILHQNSVLTRSRMGKEIVLTDIEACQHTVRFDSNSYGIFSFTASWEDNILLSCGGKIISCWDLRTKEPQFTYKIPTQMGRFEVLKLKADSHLLATGDSDGDIAFWDLRVVSSTATSPIGASSSATSSVSAVGLDSTASSPHSSQTKSPGHIKSFIHGLSPICGLYFDNSKLVSASKAGITKVWDLNATGNVAAQCKIDLGSKVWCFQADDRSLVCGDRAGFIHLVDFGEVRTRFSGGMESACILQ